MIPSAAESQNESASAHASAAGTLVVATAVVAAVVVNGSRHRVSNEFPDLLLLGSTGTSTTSST